MKIIKYSVKKDNAKINTNVVRTIEAMNSQIQKTQAVTNRIVFTPNEEGELQVAVRNDSYDTTTLND